MGKDVTVTAPTAHAKTRAPGIGDPNVVMVPMNIQLVEALAAAEQPIIIKGFDEQGNLMIENAA